MAYYIDFETLTLEDFKKKVEKEDLIPSQQIILEDIEVYFTELKNNDFETIADLQKRLKTKKHVEEFAQEVDIPLEYLIVLRRMINGYHPKVRVIKAFACFEESFVTSLEKLGIKTTLTLYDYIIEAEHKQNLLSKLPKDTEDLVKVMKLSDLCRLRYVNEDLAILLYEAGYESVYAVSCAEAYEMNSRIKTINKDKTYYRGNIGEKDMRFLIEDAKCLSIDAKL